MDKNINIKLKKISLVISIGHKKAEPGSNIFLMWSINSGLLLKRNRICAKIWKTFNSGAWRVQRLESAKYTERGVKHRSCLTWLWGKGDNGTGKAYSYLIIILAKHDVSPGMTIKMKKAGWIACSVTLSHYSRNRACSLEPGYSKWFQATAAFLEAC